VLVTLKHEQGENNNTDVLLCHRVVLGLSSVFPLACNSSPSPLDEAQTCWHTQKMCTAYFRGSPHVDCEGTCAGCTIKNSQLQTIVI